MVTATATATAVDPFAALNNTAAAKPVTANEAGSAERFLKLLVTQMQNQDPLNPMDNAQITSQMAQINTVNGIQTLNTTVQGLNSQFAQMQVLQGASLVGRDVTVAGNQLAFENGEGLGGFDLAGTADSVKVEVLTGAGKVVDTVDLGAQSAGAHSFTWAPGDKLASAQAEGWRFRVTAQAGTVAVGSTLLMRDRVESVSLVGDKLTLQTERSGNVPYSAVKAFN
jgi:flagellar basal-body rod modification protein FlgD